VYVTYYINLALAGRPVHTKINFYCIKILGLLNMYTLTIKISFIYFKKTLTFIYSYKYIVT